MEIRLFHEREEIALARAVARTLARAVRRAAKQSAANAVPGSAAAP
jgi:hypothetical protein